MSWMGCLAVVLLMALGDPALAGGSIGYQYGHRGEGQIHAEDGDPVWRPTVSQLAGWVSGGIDASRLDLPLWQAVGVSAWWKAGNGIGFSAGSLVGVVVITPQLVATAAGWDAAWDDATWERIEADQQAVAWEIAERLWGSGGVFSGQLPILVLYHPYDAEAPMLARAAIHAYGEWRYVQMGGGGTVGSYASDRPSGARPTRDWAARYATAWLMYDVPSHTLILAGSLTARQRQAPMPALTDCVSAPSSGWRLILGRPEEYAWLDF